MSEDGQGPIEEAAAGGVEEAVASEEARAPWFRLRRTWAEMRPVAPMTALAGWVGVVIVVALARVDPWNEWASWRRWLRADERGWELLIPGLLVAAATWMVTRAHTRWTEEGWSPEVVAMVLIGTAAGAGAVVWGLYALGLRPFA